MKLLQGPGSTLALCLYMSLALLVSDAARAVLIERLSTSGYFQDPELQQRSSRFLSQATAPFAVNGSSLPNITWNVGESYAGLLPISDSFNETRKLFFWFFPSYSSNPKNEIVIWLNGGPGCSSMEGILQGNGPINWLPGTDSPVPNPFTWLNLTNVVWIDQPVGVGYTQGKPSINTEKDLAMQFAGFWKRFVEVFRIENWRVYLTGESYAGFYIPYIAGAFIGAGDTTYYNLAGVHMNAAVIGDSNLQMNMLLPAYAARWNKVLGLNETFMADLQRRASLCGFTRYIREHLTFPAPAKSFRQIGWQNETWAPQNCVMFLGVSAAARLLNPCFNVYHITDACPWPSSVLGPVYTDSNQQQPPWFSQPSVRAALHVPGQGNWVRCSTGVFRNRTDGSALVGDPYSEAPAVRNLLSRVIEYTNNVIIGSGGLDMLVPTDGTLLVLQNVTWGGLQGFQERPSKAFFSPYGHRPSLEASSIAGVVGKWGAERGLTFYEVDLAGHELPRQVLHHRL
ncbi:hypothetical protein Q7P37_010702 [Cladosporium fusiforme]